MAKKPTQSENVALIQKDVSFLAERVTAIESKINWFIGIIVLAVLSAVMRLILK